MRTAVAIGGCAAAVSGAVGVFTVIRRQSFAGHALADVSSAGGAAAFLLGIHPLAGFVAMSLLGAAAIEAFPLRHVRERDLVTGVVLGAGLGLAALLLELDVRTGSTTGAAITVMFGSIFAIPPALVMPALAVGAFTLGALAAFWRPLLLTALDNELAAMRGVPVRALGLLHLGTLALAVSLSAITVGAILSTALLIGPAAIALRFARRPGQAVVLAAAIGVLVTWCGIVVAYDSLDWTGRSWPVSFSVVLVLFVAYTVAAASTRRRRS